MFVNKRGLKLKFINVFMNHPFVYEGRKKKGLDDDTFHFKLMRFLLVLFVCLLVVALKAFSAF